MSEVFSCMIDALALEVAAIRKRGGRMQIELRGGEQIGQIGQIEDSWLYRFPLGEDLNLRDDTTVRLICGDQETSGILVSLRDGMLVVAVEADLGPKIAFAHLVADDSFLVERLKEQLEKVRSGEAPFNSVAAERVIGESKVQTGDVDPDPVVLQGIGSLNEEQRAAIRRSLGSDTIFVWGPPGTGKTTTLARVVEAHYRASHSVLLVSNTNIAVDTALEKVAERLQGEPDFHQGAVLRQGPVVKDELRQRFGSQVILEAVVARLSEGLLREKTELHRQIAALDRDERPLTQAVADQERLDEVRRALAETEASLEAARQSVKAREVESQQQHARASALRADLERARTMGKVRRLFSGLNPERLERELATADRAAQVAADAARSIVDDMPKRETGVRDLRGEAEQLARSVTFYPPLQECRKHLQAIWDKRHQSRDRIAAIESELTVLTEEVLGRCRVLGTTVYRTYLVSGGEFCKCSEPLVVDEAM